MARQSTIMSMKGVSAILFLAVAGLVTAGIVQIRHEYLLTGTELIGWALVPLSLLLGFTLPVRCRVIRTNRKACGNWAYGLLFGCRSGAGHWSGKFRVRLGLGHGEAKPIERRRQSSGNTAALNQPASRTKPVKVTVEENNFAKVGAWVGLISGIVSIIQAIISVLH